MKKFERNEFSIKLPKICCEICGFSEKAALHWHHIIPRTDPNCTDDRKNVLVVCSNCHNKIHSNIIKIIDIFDATKLPYKRIVIFEENGKKNLEI